MNSRCLGLFSNSQFIYKVTNCVFVIEPQWQMRLFISCGSGFFIFFQHFFFTLLCGNTRTGPIIVGWQGGDTLLLTDMNWSRQTANTNTIIHTVPSAMCVARGHSQTHISLEMSASRRETHVRRTGTCPVILWYLSRLFLRLSEKDSKNFISSKQVGAVCGMCFFYVPVQTIEWSLMM